MDSSCVQLVQGFKTGPVANLGGLAFLCAAAAEYIYKTYPLLHTNTPAAASHDAGKLETQNIVSLLHPRLLPSLSQ